MTNIKSTPKPPKVGGKLTKLENASGDKFFLWVPIEQFQEMFKWYEYNRGGKIDWTRIHHIAYSIAYLNTDWQIAPLIVDYKTGISLDGFHTGHAILEAHEKYGYNKEIPVLVINLPKGISIGEAVRKLNNDRKSHTLEMIILDLILNGNKDYKRLQDLAETLEAPFVDDRGNVRWRYTAALKGKSQQTELKAGTFSLSEKETEEMLEIGHQIFMFWADAGKPKIGPWFESFIVAWCSRVANTKPAIVELMYNKVSKAIIKGDFVFDGSNQVITWGTRFNEAIMGEHLISITGEPIIPGKRVVNE